jgi:hypothetical protein
MLQYNSRFRNFLRKKNGLYSWQPYKMASEGINNGNAISLNFEEQNSHTKFCEINCELARALLYYYVETV